MEIEYNFNSYIAKIKELCRDMPRHTTIRINKWIEKLSEPTANPIWKKSRNNYAALLLHQTITGKFCDPFHKFPSTTAPLPILPQHMVRSIKKKSKNILDQIDDVESKKASHPSLPEENSHYTTNSIVSTLDRQSIVKQKQCGSEEKEEYTPYVLKFEHSQAEIAKLQHRIEQLEAELDSERALRLRDRKRLQQLHETEINEMKMFHEKEIERVRTTTSSLNSKVKALQLIENYNDNEDDAFMKALAEFQATSESLLEESNSGRINH